MAIERALGSKGRDTVWPRHLAWPLTFLLVVIGWVMFRSPNIGTATSFYAGMIGLNGVSIRADIEWQMRDSEFVFLCLAAMLCIVPALKRRLKMPQKLAPVIYSFLLALSVTKLAADSYSPFLYFQF